MAGSKTKPTGKSVRAFIDAIPDEKKRRDSRAILAMMKKAAGATPKMWGPGIVGFGSYHYKYASGREGDWPLTGFSPRKQALTLYIMPGFKRYDALLAKLGKFKTRKACLYIKRLEDVDTKVLETLITQSVRHMKKSHP
jgi:hypothetical protein